MDKINWTRVILGGLLAGVVINVVEFVLNSLVLGPQFAAAMEALGKPGGMTAGVTASMVAVGFALGIFAVWLYAAIRPRYGAGPKTAIRAGFAVWLLGYLLMSLFPIVTGLFPAGLMTIALVVGVVELPVATLLGAWLYKEEATAAGTSAAAAGV
jgi:MFS family permease